MLWKNNSEHNYVIRALLTPKYATYFSSCDVVSRSGLAGCNWNMWHFADVWRMTLTVAAVLTMIFFCLPAACSLHRQLVPSSLITVHSSVNNITELNHRNNEWCFQDWIQWEIRRWGEWIQVGWVDLFGRETGLPFRTIDASTAWDIYAEEISGRKISSSAWRLC